MNYRNLGRSGLKVSEICLGTDYIDIYLLYAYDQAVPLEETLSALEDIVKQGKVRYT